MREIDSKEITQAVRNACIEINTKINPAIKDKLRSAQETERSEIAQSILFDMLANFKIAQNENLPICQDTGMVIVFAEIGQDLHITGDYFEEAINNGVSEGYTKGYLRKSIVSDPLERINTGDNTPAIIHTKIVPGDKLKLIITAKGFGSENTSTLSMLKPADGIDGIKSFVLETIKKALPNSCAPIIVGIGIGGDFEKSAINAKRALTLPLNYQHPKNLYQNLSKEIKEIGNNFGYGPMGLGGNTSVLGVNIIESPTHIAGLPVAVNICCYVDRVITKEI